MLAIASHAVGSFSSTFFGSFWNCFIMSLGSFIDLMIKSQMFHTAFFHFFQLSFHNPHHHTYWSRSSCSSSVWRLSLNCFSIGNWFIICHQNWIILQNHASMSLTYGISAHTEFSTIIGRHATAKYASSQASPHFERILWTVGLYSSIHSSVSIASLASAFWSSVNQ